MPSNYSAKRKQNLVPHYYDRNSKNFGRFDPRTVPGSIVGQAHKRAYQRAAECQNWRSLEIERKVVRHG